MMQKKRLIILIVIIIVAIITFFVIQKSLNHTDSVQYAGKDYTLLEYNMDIFTYNHNSNNYYEEDIIHRVPHYKWDVVYFNGDLFVLNKQHKKAEKYYADDNNYDWYIVFDDGIETTKKSISITEEERTELYNLEDEKNKNTITFEEINMFADVLKVSKDGLVQAIIVLAQVDNEWYYKTEIMTDDDKEYVVKVSDSLNKKINKLME